jgi:hypothetical protein
MQLGTEEKHLSLKRMMIIFVIFFTILVIILLILHFNKVKQATTQIISPQAKDKEKEATPTQVSESEIAQVKMDIITGKREDVPDGVGLTKRTIIKQYLYDCYMMQDLNQKLECYELYFLNEDESLKQQKQGCEALSGDEKTKCLDGYYFEMAARSASFCEAIVDKTLRNECESAAI